MYKILRFFLCSFLLLSGFSMAAEELPAYYRAKSTVNLRSSPGANDIVVGTVEKGHRVVITETKRGKDGRMWGHCSQTTACGLWVCMNYMQYDCSVREAREQAKASSSKSSLSWQSCWNCLLNFLGRGQENIWWFYGCLALVIVSAILSVYFEHILILYLLFQLLAMATVYGYLRLPGDLMWQAEWDKVGLLIIPGVLFLLGCINAMWDTCKQHVMAIGSFSNGPFTSLLMVAIGLGWGFVLLMFVVCFFTEHEFLALFFLLGLLPKGHTPTIYVEGEGHITGHGYGGGSFFHGDNGYDYHYNGRDWHRS